MRQINFYFVNFIKNLLKIKFMPTENLINRLTINIKHPAGVGGDEALPLSQQYYETYIYPAIAKVLEKYEHVDVRIDKIEIDLDNVTAEDLAVKITHLLEDEIVRAFNDKTTALTNEIKNDILIKDKFQAFVHYLKYAGIPWYYDNAEEFNIDRIIQEIFSDTELEKQALKEIIHLLVQDQYALQRFYYLANDEVLDKVIHAMFFSADLKNICRIVDSSIAKLYSTQKEEIRKLFFEVLLKASFFDKNTIVEIVDLFSETVIRKIGSSAFKLDMKKTMTITDATERMESVMKTVIKHISGKKKLIISPAIPKIGEDYRQEDELSSETEKRILITNVGLVLLNPMIKNLFQNLGFTDSSEKFRSEDLRHRAVHILQSLTGNPGKHYEHLLPLNKIICGMNVLTPVDPVFHIKKQERDETNDLLKAVLTHWSVLKSNSVKGLQESFINRKGSIEKSGNDWIVRVENSGIDLLLDDLPWSINILKYPWNNYIIYVEWKHWK